jgi:hypothetical protein
MAEVQMLCSIQGGRGDGREWPPFMGIIDVPDGEAEDLVNGALAQWPEDPDTGDSEPEDVPEDEDAEADFEDSDEDAEAEPDEDFDNDEEPLPDVKRKPYVNESRNKWITYAVSRGMPPEEAHVSTKNALVKKYKDL